MLRAWHLSLPVIGFHFLFLGILTQSLVSLGTESNYLLTENIWKGSETTETIKGTVEVQLTCYTQARNHPGPSG